jgi:hypothetical protein
MNWTQSDVGLGPVQGEGSNTILNWVDRVHQDQYNMIMIKIARYLYLFFAGLFLVGIVVQVFLAGMVVVAVQMPWDSHIGLGHTLAGPLLFMLITMYAGRLPRSMKWMTWLLFGVYFLQSDVVIFLRTQAPVVSALHPVLAMVDFALILALVRRAWPLARQVSNPARVDQDVETSGIG